MSKKSESPSYLQSWIVCLSAALFFFYEFIQMQMFNSISKELLQAFHLNAQQLGLVSAAYLYADVLFLLPAGIILDRASTRTVILLALFLCILGTLGFAFTSSVWLASFYHFIAGIGNAFCFLSCIRLASRWFPSSKIAFVSGIIVTIAMAGGILAQSPMIFLVQHVGWRHTVLLNAFLGIAIFVIIFCTVKNYPPSYKPMEDKGKATLQKIGFSKSLLYALSNTQNWLGGIYTSLLNLPIILLCALWGNLYLMQVHHLSQIKASYVIIMLFMGTIIGAPLFGWLSDYIKRRRLPMIVGAFFSLLTISFLFIPSSINFPLLLILFFLLGFFTSTQVISYPLITESSPAMLTSTSTGFASILIMGIGAIFQPMFGYIMDTFSSSMQLGYYSLEAYHYALIIFPLSFLIASILALLIKETYCQPLPLTED